MVLNDVFNLFERKVFHVRPGKLLFNQYSEIDLSVDRTGAHEIRRENLIKYLKSFSRRPFILIVGEAPGPRGCRFSGVPFTSEAQLCKNGFPFTGLQSSSSDSLYSESSAEIFWTTLLPYHPKFLVWNSVPFHPHKLGERLSIRNPTSVEVSIYSDLLLEMVSLIKPKCVVAVGKKAELGLKHKGITHVSVRHPSHGGANDFKGAVRGIFNDL